MSTGSVSGSSGSTSTGNTSTSSSNGLQGYSVNDFMNMLVSELQNQDPTNPTDSSTIMSQIGTIQSIESTQQLQSTMQSMQLSQDVTTANNLLGRQITGLDTGNNTVTGVVNSVAIAGGNITLNVANSTVTLNNVSSISTDSSSSSTTTNQLLNYLDQLLTNASGNGNSTNTGNTSS